MTSSPSNETADYTTSTSVKPPKSISFYSLINHEQQTAVPSLDKIQIHAWGITLKLDHDHGTSLHFQPSNSHLSRLPLPVCHQHLVGGISHTCGAYTGVDWCTSGLHRDCTSFNSNLEYMKNGVGQELKKERLVSRGFVQCMYVQLERDGA